jgi:hypothetical protein
VQAVGAADPVLRGEVAENLGYLDVYRRAVSRMMSWRP